MAPDRSNFDHESSRTIKSKGFDKKVVIALGLVIVALLAVVITFIVLYVEETEANPSKSPIDGAPECSTEGCKEAAANLKKSMNVDINPCDDFYEFACGRWSEEEKIPDDKGSWNIFNVLRLELSQALLTLLNVTHAEGVQLNATQKMQKHFQSCMDEEALNKTANIKLWRDHIQEIFPQFSGFPWMDMTKAPTADESFAAVARARKYGLTMGLFSNYVSSDYENPRQNMIYFAASALGMERSLYLKENGTELPAYEKFLTDMFYLFGEKSNPGQLKQEDANLFAKNVIEFEKELAQARLSPQERRQNSSITFNKMTLRQFADSYTSKMGINSAQLVQYFKGAWNNPSLDAKLSGETVINVDEVRYYEVLANKLASLRSNDPVVRTQSSHLFANYMVWQIGGAYVGRLGNDFRNISRTFSSVLSGISTSAPRWESCVNSISEEFPEAVGRLYVEKNFEKSTKERLQMMVNYLDRKSVV